MDTEKLIELAEKHAALDLAPANAAALEIRSMILSALSTPEGTIEALELLNHPAASSWVAFAALEHGALTEFQHARCLSAVRTLAAGQDIEAAGAKAWLAGNGREA